MVKDFGKALLMVSNWLRCLMDGLLGVVGVLVRNGGGGPALHCRWRTNCPQALRSSRPLNERTRVPLKFQVHYPKISMEKLDFGEEHQP